MTNIREIILDILRRFCRESEINKVIGQCPSGINARLLLALPFDQDLFRQTHLSLIRLICKIILQFEQP